PEGTRSRTGEDGRVQAGGGAHCISRDLPLVPGESGPAFSWGGAHPHTRGEGGKVACPKPPTAGPPPYTIFRIVPSKVLAFPACTGWISSIWRICRDRRAGTSAAADLDGRRISVPRLNSPHVRKSSKRPVGPLQP